MSFSDPMVALRLRERALAGSVSFLPRPQRSVCRRPDLWSHSAQPMKQPCEYQNAACPLRHGAPVTLARERGCVKGDARRDALRVRILLAGMRSASALQRGEARCGMGVRAGIGWRRGGHARSVAGDARGSIADEGACGVEEAYASALGWRVACGRAR